MNPRPSEGDVPPFSSNLALEQVTRRARLSGSQIARKSAQTLLRKARDRNPLSGQIEDEDHQLAVIACGGNRLNENCIGGARQMRERTVQVIPAQHDAATGPVRGKGIEFRVIHLRKHMHERGGLPCGACGLDP